MLSKSDFFIDPNVVFLNHGSFGATPRVLFDVQRHWQELLEKQPVEFFREAKNYMADARLALAKYIGCDMDDLVYVVNATYGVNVAAYALALSLKPGDEVLTTDHEYGACDRAWEQHIAGSGARIVRQTLGLPLPSMQEVTERIWAGVTEKTKVLFVSHITSATGALIDIKTLCARARAHGGIVTVIDGSHAPGQIPLDLSEIDADIYTANCHKWMCTPKGSGFLWVRKALQENFKPLTVSWGAAGDTLRTSDFIDEHEYLGTRDLSAFLTVPAGIEWMSGNNWREVQERGQQLRAETMDKLIAIDGIVSLLADRTDEVLQMGAILLPDHWECDDLKQWLLNTHRIEVMVQPWLGRGILRFSVHAHTSASDLEALCSAIAEYKVRADNRV